MDKILTKSFLKESGVGLLPSAVLSRPTEGLIPSAESIEEAMGRIQFPVIVKPVHLGSRIGVVKASSLNDVRTALPAIFRLDQQAILEPFVEHLEEYNVAVRTADGKIHTSAIERPLKKKDVLDFRDKYGSGSDTVTAAKRAGVMNRETLAGTREICPQIDNVGESKIRRWAEACFAAFGATGAPRIDFLSNTQSGEIWLNEVNPCPGWYAFFLWEAAHDPVLYPELLSSLVDEALTCHKLSRLPEDPVPQDARLFMRS